MIFVTVGSVLPFERLIRKMDNWASRHQDQTVFAQIGDGEYKPQFMSWVRLMDRASFAERVGQSTLMVAHAGTGSVLAACEHGVPTVLIPRYAVLREHTTNHQLDTANWLKSRPGFVVVEKDDDLDAKIEEALSLQVRCTEFSNWAPDPFISRLKNAIDN